MSKVAVFSRFAMALLCLTLSAPVLAAPDGKKKTRYSVVQHTDMQGKVSFKVYDKEALKQAKKDLAIAYKKALKDNTQANKGKKRKDKTSAPKKPSLKVLKGNFADEAIAKAEAEKIQKKWEEAQAKKKKKRGG